MDPMTIEKTHLAIKMYFEHKGIKVIEEGYELPTGGIVDYIANDASKNEDVFIFVGIVDDDYPELDKDACLDIFEKALLSYYAQHKDLEASKDVRCDIIQIAMIGDSRAIFRHRYDISGRTYHGE